MTDLDQLRYPVGKFQQTENPDDATRTAWIKVIANFPDQLRKEVINLNDSELAIPYRPDGWTIRQVVHHCADSHLNAITRFKLALTENQPTIKPYAEAAWAELTDYQLPVAHSLGILTGIHARWVVLLEGMQEEDYQRVFFHPEHGTPFSLLLTLDHYQWHCRHHLGHVLQAKG